MRFPWKYSHFLFIVGDHTREWSRPSARMVANIRMDGRHQTQKSVGRKNEIDKDFLKVLAWLVMCSGRGWQGLFEVVTSQEN